MQKQKIRKQKTKIRSPRFGSIIQLQKITDNPECDPRARVQAQRALDSLFHRLRTRTPIEQSVSGDSK